jgi:hypothetical protein
MSREKKVEFGGQVPQEVFLEFRGNFPQHGAMSWLVNEAVLQINNLVRENPHYRDIVANAIRNAIRFPLYGTDGDQVAEPIPGQTTG